MCINTYLSHENYSEVLNGGKIIMIFFILWSAVLHKHQRWTQESAQGFSSFSTNEFWYLS